jgi:ElaB/YqjD/DUF883 family membrane-anchored ribosome-binding protein
MKYEEAQKTEDRSSNEIASNIRQRRDKMDATLEELSNQFTVRSLVSSALDWWVARKMSVPGGGMAKSAYRGVAQQVKSHPFAALLVATGVTWMILEAAGEEKTQATARKAGSDESGPETGREGMSSALESAGGKVAQAGHALGEVATAAKDKASAVGEAASEAAENISRRAQEVYNQGRSAALRTSHGIQEGYRSSAEQLEIAMREYPLAVGLGFAAAGALFGVLLPRTRQEDQLMGQKSDQIVEATKEKGQELLERGKAVAERVAESTLEEAQQQGLTAQAATEKISEIAGKIGTVAQKATEKVTTASSQEGLIPKPTKEAASQEEGEQAPARK